MRLVIQRVHEASVRIDNKIHAFIGYGMMILLGVETNDTETDIDWLVNKVSALRIFSDEQQKMNLNATDISAEVMVISQFTLFASTKKGNRPGFTRAAEPEKAKNYYELFVQRLSDHIKKEVKCGIFAADMDIMLINHGPVTIIMDSHNKE